MTSKYTCITCRVAFNDVEFQRKHYKTDWHRYNLKRKVAELPPVTAEDFQKKVLKQRHDDAEISKPSATYCMVCKKSYKTAKAFINHSNSKQHQDKLEENSHSVEDSETNGTENINEHLEISCPSIGKVSKKIPNNVTQNEDESDDYETDSEVDSDDSGWEVEISENNPILKNNCLFCSHHSRSQIRNLEHMTLIHSFFIPDAEYLVDLKGLLLYLGEKVCMGFMCLWCNDKGKAFYSMESAQQHMTDKGHCKMLHEGETLAEYAEYYDYSSSYPDHAESMEVDEEVDVNIIDGNDYQLVLPSGATIGHRSLMKYYRQNFDPDRVVAPYRGKINRVLSQYRALGYKESDKQLVVKKARDINFMRRVQNKYSMMLGTKANKLQKHFRPQVNF
ncbi:zinc finger protein 622 [Nilaparvata lugens]|uniref:zinc finger protein 622 n=1 Tax=Nilaparvata lugens TaxID=108931 RepID=UPI00193DC615|nr:zinc finger protein 622 [Nilaparvata lugens]